MGKEVLMKCGHTANSVFKYNGEYKPCCAICFGITNDAVEEVELQSLENRKAKCSWCGKEVDSRYSLPFFKHKPDKEYDTFYCGCGGWN